MRSRCRNRQNAGLSRGLYSLADESSRTNETAHRYFHFQRCLAGRYPYRVSARPVRYLLDEGIITAPITAVVRKGKERFVCDARLAERASLVQPSRKRQKNSLHIAEIFWTWIISRSFPGMTVAGSVCRSPARVIAFCARIAATSSICAIP